MSVITLRLSDSVHRAARELADREEVSLNQLISTALAEKLSALSAEQIVLERARRGDRARFHALLDKVPDVPDPYEALEGEPNVENTMAVQTPAVQDLCKALISEIATDGVDVYTTRTSKGDIRFRVNGNTFAEIKFKRRTDEIDLRLYFPPDDVLDAQYKLFERKTSKQAKYDRRLNAAEAIPDDVVRNIRRSRAFMMAKRNGS